MILLYYYTIILYYAYCCKKLCNRLIGDIIKGFDTIDNIKNLI